MTYDFILMNPPYSLGGKITNEAKKHENKTVCLMPLSCYKAEKNELYRYVDEMGLADPKVFEGADITNNLCICTLQNHKVNRFKTYEEMAMESYDPKFKKFYEANSKLPLRYHISEKRNAKAEDFDKDLDVLDTNRLPDETVGYMFGGTGFGYKWNILKDYSKVSSGASCVHMPSKKAKDNYTIWLYKKNHMGTLADKLIWGTNKITVSSTCSIAIPQIDWETISDTQLWKEGKYDEAVLDVMGLKWDGDVIVENRGFE